MAGEADGEAFPDTSAGRLAGAFERFVFLLVKQRSGNPADSANLLAPTQTLALSEVVDHGPLRIGALSELVGATDATATRTADGLEALGLIERVPDPNDRRAVLIAATPRGRRSVRDRRSRIAQLFEETVGSSHDDELRALRRALRGPERARRPGAPPQPDVVGRSEASGMGAGERRRQPPVRWRMNAVAVEREVAGAAGAEDVARAAVPHSPQSPTARAPYAAWAGVNPSNLSCATMPLRENGIVRRYSLAAAAASFIQFAPEWVPPYVASLVENPSNFSCETRPFNENASTRRYCFAERTACARLIGVACAGVEAPSGSAVSAAAISAIAAVRCLMT